MANRRNPRGLLDDDEMRIDVAENKLVEMRRHLLGDGEHLDLVAGLQAADIVEPDLAVEFDASAGDQLADLRPALARQPAAQSRGQRLVRERFCRR